MLVEGLQLLQGALPILHPLACQPDVLPENPGEDTGNDEAERIDDARTDELRQQDNRRFGRGWRQDPLHLQIQKRHVAGCGERRPDDRPPHVQLQAPQQDHDDVHERENAVVETRGENDEGDERDIHDRLEDEKREGDLAAPPEGVPGEEPPVRQYDSDVQVLESDGKDEIRLPNLDVDRRNQEGKGDPRPKQEEIPAFCRLFFPAPSGDR